MFSFFKKKTPQAEAPSVAPAPAPLDAPAARASAAADAPALPAPAEPPRRGWIDKLRSGFTGQAVPAPGQPPGPSAAPTLAPAPPAPTSSDTLSPLVPRPAAPSSPVLAPAPVQPAVPPAPAASPALPVPSAAPPSEPISGPPADRRGWMDKLRSGLRKTGSSIAQVFTGTQIDEALYEDLESALLMADAGVKATEFLLKDLRRRVKEAKASDPAAVKSLLADAVTDLLTPLEKSLQIGEHSPTVMMVIGVNGAGKTTTIGKLTRHLADNSQKVLLAAADTFRAAAREQLAVWADRADAPNADGRRGEVEIVSQASGDPASVSFDAVVAGKSRGCDVVIADTAGRLPTQLHLMEELKKIKRVIGKAQDGAPHEVLLVVDGNTGQNALSQVKSFDDALSLTGLIVTKLDGTAKGGVLAAIARERPIPVYFVGVGERLEDLQTFRAREFAQALLL